MSGLNEVGEKVCRCCLKSLAYTAFGVSSKSAEGRSNQCKPCRNAEAAAWRRKNQESAKAAQQRYVRANADAVRERHRRYIERNKDAVREQRRAYREKNLEAEKARALKSALRWAQENPERARANKRAWKRANRHLVCEDVVRRQHATKQATPSWSNADVVKGIYALARTLTERTGVRHEVDHIVPIRSKLVCGLHAHTNLRVLPFIENRKKHNKHWPDMP